MKKVDGVITETTDYVLSNKTLISMKKGNNTLYFSYDMSGGSPVMVTFNGAKYTYVKNLLGDIVALVDASGNIVSEYKYDAWGKPLCVTGTMAQTIGALNPFRYRGYIWDEDMESYYLRSRHYNPSICRFLQADALLTMNAFAYANNNPVMKVDADGTRASDNGSTSVAIIIHCGGKDGTGWHYTMEIAGINFSFDTNHDVTIRHGDDIWNGERKGDNLPYILVLTGVPYEDAVKGIEYWMQLTHGGIVAKEVSASDDVFTLFHEKGWIGGSYSSWKKYDFENFPCVGPIVEALEEMNIQLIWGDCFKADKVGDKEYGYVKPKNKGDSNFRFAYIFRNIYLKQQITFMRRNADGLYEPY